LPIPEEFKAGCARPTGGPVGEPAEKSEPVRTETTNKKEGSGMTMVGEKGTGFFSAGV